MSVEKVGNEGRYARRLVFALLWLALFDQFAPELLRRFEARRYEESKQFRFENADLFGLGPLVSHLRENPHSRLPRTVFLGNSVVFGYGLAATDAVPAQYQKLERKARVLNAAVNGFQLGSSYLIAKSMLNSVDTFFIQVVGVEADPMLPALIPVSDADVRRFRLSATDPFESRLRSLARIWRLYDLNYRFQAALLGTSTREYLHRHKKDLVLSWIAPVPARAPQASISRLGASDAVLFRSPRAGTPPTEKRKMQLRGEQQLLWEFAALMRSLHKRAVFMQIDRPLDPKIAAEVADFNAAFAPFAEMILVSIPPGLKFDGRHMTSCGASELARALALHEMQRVEAR